MTITSASTTYAGELTTATSVAGTYATAALTEGCRLAGTTAATCTAAFTVSAGGQSTKTSNTVTLTGSDYHRFDVQITGGAEKLGAAASVTCASKPNAAPGRDATGVLVTGLAFAGAVIGVLLV